MIRFVLTNNECFGRLISGSSAFLRRWDNCSVTVIGSVVVVCLLCVELVWANASGAINIRTRMTIVFFMMPPFYWPSFCSWFGLNRSHFLFLPQPTFTSSAAHIVARARSANRRLGE